MVAEPAGLGDALAEDAVSRERARLAYAIHDGLTQVVTASVLELEWLARRAEVEPRAVAEVLSRAIDELRRALEDIREMLTRLSPEEPSSADRLEDLVHGMVERWHLPAAWSIEGDLQSVPRPVLEAASSVIRESVANAAKHAASSDVSVRVQVLRSALEVAIEDHGRGFDPTTGDPENGHLGLEMMRRRVAALSGTLDIRSSPGRGTRVVARLPVSNEGDEP
jgi:signal transduction histidine kinase